MSRSTRMAPPPPAGSVWIDGAARRIGLSVATLRKWRQSDVGPHSYTIGRKVAYELSVLDAWLNGRKKARREPSPDMAPPEPRRPRVSV
jgi:predicted DNA-binding transcriptional regulator AlpA